MTANTAFVESTLDDSQNWYLIILLLPKQYSHIVTTPFVSPTYLVITETFPERALPGEENGILL